MTNKKVVLLKKWTKKDYIYSLLAMIIKFGDGIEIYLLGVLNQKATCELRVSRFFEGIVSATFFFIFALSTMTAVPLAQRFGERKILLISLYISVFFAVFCAAVPNYHTLIFSRALVGLGVGLNSATIGVFVSKAASSQSVADLSLFMKGSIALTLGGGWVSLLGWLVMDAVQWQTFIVLTSLPLFALAILILHFCTEEEPEWELPEHEPLIGLIDLDERDFAKRVTKASLFVFCNISVGYGIIILLPSIIREHKLDLMDDSVVKFHYNRVNIDKQPNCDEIIVHGDDLLILAAVSGAANAVGRPLGYFLRGIFKFRPLQSFIALTTAVSYSIMLSEPGLTIECILMGVATFSFSIQDAEVSILPYDLNYFSPPLLSLGAGIVICVGMLGAILGTSIAAFFASKTAILVCLNISVIQVAVILLMKEK